MTRLASVNSFWTRTETSATRIAVKSPSDPRRAVMNVRSSGSIWIIRKMTRAIDALTMGSCWRRFPRSYAMAMHATTPSRPKVAVTGICRS